MIALQEVGGRPASETTIKDIQKLCEQYDNACAALHDDLAKFKEELATLKAKHLPGISKLAKVVANTQAELYTAIEGAPELWESPRTVVLHGIKVGMNANPGKLEFADAKSVVMMLREHLKGKAKNYIRITEAPDKEALKTLPGEVLERLGCQIVGAGDTVVLTRTKGDVEEMFDEVIDKLVNKIVEAK
jgi:hypothetical protein